MKIVERDTRYTLVYLDPPLKIIGDLTKGCKAASDFLLLSHAVRTMSQVAYTASTGSTHSTLLGGPLFLH